MNSFHDGMNLLVSLLVTDDHGCSARAAKRSIYTSRHVIEKGIWIAQTPQKHDFIIVTG